MALRIPVNDLDHVIGPASAPVIVVNYGDYQCPDCHRRHRAIQKVVDELVGSVPYISPFSTCEGPSSRADRGGSSGSGCSTEQIPGDASPFAYPF